MEKIRAERLLRVRYLIGLGLIALLVTGAYATMSLVLAEQRNFARLINYAGHQSGLANRIAYFGMMMAHADGDTAFEAARAQVGSSMQQMQRVHQMLLNGDKTEGIPLIRNQHLDEIYFNETNGLDDAMQRFLDVANDVYLLEPGTLTSDDYAYVYLTTSGPQRLESMLDAAVDEYEQINRDAFQYIEKLELIFWLSILVVLVLEAVFIFRPLEKRIRSAIARLQQTVEELETTREQYAVAKQKAESASEAKSQFLATMTHELRTPMNGVLGMSEVLLGTRMDKKQSEYVQIIVDSSESLLTIINDILDFSRLEAGKVGLESIPLNLEQAAYDVLALLAPRCQNKTLQLILDYAPDLPRNFIGDPARIRQILFNLIGNASKFTEQGYIQVSISVDVDEDDCGQISIHVEDTGIGIAPDKIKRLFHSFTQADNSTTRKYGGTGLGLTITRELINLMGGSIGVDSAPDKGSVFTVEFPLKIAPQIDDMPAPQLMFKHVMLFEPHDIYRDLIVDRLERVGVEATVVSSADDIRRRLRTCLEHGGAKQVVIVTQDALLDKTNRWKRFADEDFGDTVSWIVLSNGGEDSSLFRKNVQYLQGYTTYMQKPFTNYQLYYALNTTTSQPEVELLSAKIGDDDTTDFTLTRSKRGEILLVEDNHANQKFASLILSKIGYSVDLAENGLQAIELWRRNNYDLILMDCLMPDMDGYEATVKIRQEEASRDRIPIIALTANASEKDRERCRLCGMDEIITKPYRKQELADVLNRWLHDEPSFITITHNVTQQKAG